jgi:hypothetical protein
MIFYASKAPTGQPEEDQNSDFKEYFQRHCESIMKLRISMPSSWKRRVASQKRQPLQLYRCNKWMWANYEEPLRRWIKKRRIEEITDFGDLPVFDTATTYPEEKRIIA